MTIWDGFYAVKLKPNILTVITYKEVDFENIELNFFQ